MIIGLYNLEPRIENTAMMQVSQFHKQLGDQVEKYIHFLPERYKNGKVYAFSIFKETPKHMVRDFMIRGGTGFNVRSRLPPEIEESALDYSIFPRSKASYIWFSRGCIRKCPFCIVHEKEGDIRPVEPRNLNPNGNHIQVMDNNFFASPKWREAIERLVEWNQPVIFSSGIDIRIFNEEQGEALKRLRIPKDKFIHIAWDNPRDNPVDKIELLKKYIHHRKIMCYVLIGYWSTPEEDMMRVMKLKELGVDPFVMKYDVNDRYQKAFARWVNFKAIFKTIPWEKYHQNPNPSKWSSQNRYLESVLSALR